MKLTLPDVKAVYALVQGKLPMTEDVFNRNYKLLRAYAAGAIKWSAIADGFPQTEEWRIGCYNEPWRSKMVMSALDEIVHGYGVGSVDGCETRDRNRLEYVNFGDPYIKTLLHYQGSSKVFIGAWGDCIK